jgi:hypothetical protein
MNEFEDEEEGEEELLVSFLNFAGTADAETSIGLSLFFLDRFKSSLVVDDDDDDDDKRFCC